WVEGWEKPNKGRIYRVLDPARRNDSHALEVKRLLAEGMEKRPNEELSKLLAHADMRVRQEAQFELARRRDTQVLALIARSGSETSILARIHAIWGLGQIARNLALRRAPSLWTAFEPLLGDGDSEIRAQTARVLGDAREVASLDRLVGL